MSNKVITEPATIKINKSTLNRIKKQGHYGETIDEILIRLLNQTEKANFS